METINKDMDYIEAFRRRLALTDAVVIGAGAGLSAAAGFSYSGERFKRYFGEFIERYQMTDMYSAGFYPFETPEEKWAYWSRHIYYNRYNQPPGEVYLDLLELVRDMDYFVITTNVDHQFWLAGFEPERIFATQGDYGLFQCAEACHKRLYQNEAQVRAMVARQKDCRVPSSLVPQCPVCGNHMEVNLRCDSNFVEDETWNRAAMRYDAFLKEKGGRGKEQVMFLELGVGMNTPAIIKYPFWQMTNRWKNAYYICVNQGQAWAPREIRGRSLCIDGDISEVFKALKGEIQ